MNIFIRSILIFYPFVFIVSSVSAQERLNDISHHLCERLSNDIVNLTTEREVDNRLKLVIKDRFQLSSDEDLLILKFLLRKNCPLYRDVFDSTDFSFISEGTNRNAYLKNKDFIYKILDNNTEQLIKELSLSSKKKKVRKNICSIVDGFSRITNEEVYLHTTLLNRKEGIVFYNNLSDFQSDVEKIICVLVFDQEGNSLKEVHYKIEGEEIVIKK